jgi:LPS sulfotransferase NodH
VSLWKAIQTWTWRTDDTPLPSGDSSHSGKKLIFNFEAIDHLLQRIMVQEADWQRYFNASGIKPLTVVYEDLTAAYEATAIKILNYLDIAIPENLAFAERRMKRQANALSEEWIERYYNLKRLSE